MHEIKLRGKMVTQKKVYEIYLTFWPFLFFIFCLFREIFTIWSQYLSHGKSFWCSCEFFFFHFFFSCNKCVCSLFIWNTHLQYNENICCLSNKKLKRKFFNLYCRKLSMRIGHKRFIGSKKKKNNWKEEKIHIVIIYTCSKFHSNARIMILTWNCFFFFCDTAKADSVIIFRPNCLWYERKKKRTNGYSNGNVNKTLVKLLVIQVQLTIVSFLQTKRKKCSHKLTFLRFSSQITIQYSPP